MDYPFLLRLIAMQHCKEFAAVAFHGYMFVGYDELIDKLDVLYPIIVQYVGDDVLVNGQEARDILFLIKLDVKRMIRDNPHQLESTVEDYARNKKPDACFIKALRDAVKLASNATPTFR